MSDQSGGGVSALQYIQLLCQKAGLVALTTVLEAQKLIVERLAVITGNKIQSAALTAESDAFKLEKEAVLIEVDKSKNELSSRPGEEYTMNLAELHRKYDADVRF